MTARDTAARVDEIDIPYRPFRWLIVPAVGWAVLSAAASMLRRRGRRPTVSPMSQEWLRHHGVSAGRGWNNQGWD